jgi:NlpC/P60 family putative phage cell wall peptidase
LKTRAQLVSCARGYRGTPFQHQGRLKGAACDCVGLVFCVADDLELQDKNGTPIRRNQYTNYGPQPVDRFVHEECQRMLLEKPITSMQEGDLLTLRLPTWPSHVAIVTDIIGYTGIIHAYSTAGKVVEHILDKKWKNRIEGCFSFPGVE